MEALSKLKPVFGNPSITAGNAPGLNDGATAQILMKRSTAKKMGLTPLYMIEDMVSIAAAPNLLPVAPALAIKKLMNRTGLTLDQVDIIEINEAFACVPLVSLKLLSCRAFIEDDYAHAAAHIANYPIDTFNEVTFKKLLGKLNVNGGAIAIGHANIKQAVIRWKHGFGLGPLAKLPVKTRIPRAFFFSSNSTPMAM